MHPVLYRALLIIHVVSVIIWIGGVAFVTTVIFPLMYRTEGSVEKALLFQRVERRFAGMVRVLVVVVGATGAWMLADRFGPALLLRHGGLGILSMLIAWTFYTAVLLSEQKIFSRVFADPDKIDMDQALKIINAVHWLLLAVSFAAVAAGVWMAHG